jgi:glucan phosphoethanolaminetransferase (alkaline phosphatase superfamily)
VYIDGFGGGYSSLHSGMSVTENKLIDQTTSVRGDPKYLRDFFVAKKLTEALAEPEPAFIYVDKFGVHIPYENKYPPDHARFPVISDDSRQKLIGLYKNAVGWSVDEFFSFLLSSADLSDTLIVYTSDHGQLQDESLQPNRAPCDR